MSVLASFLVLVSIGFLVGGLSMRSTEAYTVAAICSAIAVMLMWRHLKATKETAFVTNGPVATMPDWQKPRMSLSSGPKEPLSQLKAPVVAIDDYDSLMAAEILPSLETLSVEELEAVVAREKSGLQRQGVISRARKLIDLTRGPTVGVGSDGIIETSALETVIENSTRRRLIGRRKSKDLTGDAVSPAPPLRPKTIDKPDPDLSL